MYAGEAFAESVRAYRGLVERAAAASDDATRARMARHFYKGCELEWMFWDAALKTQVKHGVLCHLIYCPCPLVWARMTRRARHFLRRSAVLTPGAHALFTLRFAAQAWPDAW